MTKRVRRFVRGKTAIGQRKKGGLNNMDWKLHAEAFYAEWMVKYLQPPKSAWKDLLDQFIVFDNRGLQKFATARSAVLNPDSKSRHLQGLPKKAMLCSFLEDGHQARFDLQRGTQRRIHMEQP